MLTRRSVLKSGAASAAALALTTPAFAADPTPSEKLNKLFDTFIDENLDLSPTFATSLGVDKGPRAKQKYELDESSLASIKKGQDLQASQLQRLEAFDRASVPASDQLTYDIVDFNLKNQVADNAKYQYAGGGAGAPYIISQKNGQYSNIPSFLDNQHTIETKEDADAYLARLEQFGA